MGPHGEQMLCSMGGLPLLPKGRPLATWAGRPGLTPCSCNTTLWQEALLDVHLLASFR